MLDEASGEADERRAAVVAELSATDEPAAALLGLAKLCAQEAGEYAVGLVADVASDMGRIALEAAERFHAVDAPAWAGLAPFAHRDENTVWRILLEGVGDALPGDAGAARLIGSAAGAGNRGLRLAAIAGYRGLGGPEALEGLRRLMGADDPVIQRAAREALADLER
ncbi:MAG: hypothetical protein K2W96_14240 [Gemmataceae bacterium]|nr:hypothetical protein [Gemmataceae bacterium]